MLGYDPYLTQRYLDEIARKCAQELQDRMLPFRPADHRGSTAPIELAKDSQD